MSKSYSIDLNIDVSQLKPEGGILFKDEAQTDKRSGPEVFLLMAKVAINQVNQRVSYDQLKAIRKVLKDLEAAVPTGIYTANRTDIDIIKNSIRANRGWPNHEDTLIVLDQIMNLLTNAKESDPSDNQGANPGQEK